MRFLSCWCIWYTRVMFCHAYAVVYVWYLLMLLTILCPTECLEALLGKSGMRMGERHFVRLVFTGTRVTFGHACAGKVHEWYLYIYIIVLLTISGLTECLEALLGWSDKGMGELTFCHAGVYIAPEWCLWCQCDI